MWLFQAKIEVSLILKLAPQEYLVS